MIARTKARQAALALSVAAAWALRPDAGASPARPERPAQELGPPSPEDPALLRKRLLDRLDARIDRFATQARLELRLALDEVYPISFLGVDSHTEDGRLVLNAVYPETGASEAGLRVGDVVRSFAGAPLTTRDELARAVRAQRVGASVELAVERDGRPLRLHAVLGARSGEDEDFEEQFPDLFAMGPAPPPGTRAPEAEWPRPRSGGPRAPQASLARADARQATCGRRPR